MSMKVLPPEEAKKDIRAKVAEWKRQKADEEKRKKLEAKKPKPEPKAEPEPGPKEEPKAEEKRKGQGLFPSPMARKLPAAPKVLTQKEKDEMLHAAVEGNSATMVSRMLRDGANIEARDENGWTPLMRACMIGRNGNVSTDIVDILTKANADVDAGDPTGWTPLMFAALHGSLGAARILLACGADPDRTNQDGDTADRISTDARIVKAIKRKRKARG